MGDSIRMRKGVWAMKRTTRLVQVLMVFVLCLAGMAGAADAMEYKGYINKIFGYSLEYPDIFFDGTFEENGKEVVMESIHKKYHLKVWGRDLKKKENAKSLFKAVKEDLEKDGSTPIKHSAVSGKNSFSIGYTDPNDPDVLIAQYGVVNGKRAAFFVFRYPHDEYEVFQDILKHMGKTFRVF